VTLSNGANTTYTNTGIVGTYNVTFYANDTHGTKANTTASFERFLPATLNITVNDTAGGINTTLTIYYGNSTQSTNTSNTGQFNIDTINTLLELEFKAYEELLKIEFHSTNLSEVYGKNLGIDRHNETEGYLITYGISPAWDANNATITISYSNTNHAEESALTIHKCDSYNLTSRTCNSGWSDVTYQATQDTSQDTFELSVTSFSGFSIKEQSTTTEQSNRGSRQNTNMCTERWRCTDWSECANTARTRECSDLNSCGTNISKPKTTAKCTISQDNFQKTQENEASPVNENKTDETHYEIAAEHPGAAELQTQEKSHKKETRTIIKYIIALMAGAAIAYAVARRENQKQKLQR
jgi:hypothetical protein